MPKYINQSPRWQRDFIKTITPSSVFLPARLPRPSGHFFWKVSKNFADMIWWLVEFPLFGENLDPETEQEQVPQWEDGNQVWEYVHVSVQHVHKNVQVYVCLKQNLELSHISEIVCNYGWNFYESVLSGRLMSLIKWFNHEILLYNWVHFNAERGRFA